MRLKGIRARRKSDESALTLVEVMVATAILVICYVSLYGVMTFGASTARSSRQDLRATEIMEQKMEQIRLYNWLQVTNNVSTGYMNPAPFKEYFNPLYTNQDPVYWCRVSITNVPTSFPASYQANMVRVRVVVLWTNYGHGAFISHARTNDTYVARYGMQQYVIN